MDPTISAFSHLIDGCDRKELVMIILGRGSRKMENSSRKGYFHGISFQFAERAKNMALVNLSYLALHIFMR
jgi:hypothetical protein